ncbi:MAG TPA: hypothetical protein VMG38_04745 [Trebonia sp.]|nr:hypothetical protein [Trebonia sp.]
MAVVVPQHAAVTQGLRLQPHIRTEGAEAHPLGQYRSAPQPRLDGGTGGKDPVRNGGPGSQVPGVGVGRAPQHQVVAVREDVGGIGSLGRGTEELLDPRVLDDHHLPAQRHHGRVGHQVSRAYPRAVHDDRRIQGPQ